MIVEWLVNLRRRGGAAGVAAGDAAGVAAVPDEEVELDLPSSR